MCIEICSWDLRLKTYDESIYEQGDNFFAFAEIPLCPDKELELSSDKEQFPAYEGLQHDVNFNNWMNHTNAYSHKAP